jgi:hypothetical protein
MMLAPQLPTVVAPDFDINICKQYLILQLQQTVLKDGYSISDADSAPTVSLTTLLYSSS